ncbi:hypothetical protein [Mycobacterium sp. 852002-10029_SCH5224772]|uniref:hypothetical protein n=1 Tax=Mycobacterium sp. 852002-10029_SCH5224772 TaxID=1834083 RepID=UPI000AD4E0A6|nr:hypothetical protein [Mycobacterium sp. 852002-10029_SCH5224772]
MTAITERDIETNGKVLHTEDAGDWLQQERPRRSTDCCWISWPVRSTDHRTQRRPNLMYFHARQLELMNSYTRISEQSFKLQSEKFSEVI